MKNRLPVKKFLILLIIGLLGYLFFMPTIYQQKQAELEMLGVNVDLGYEDSSVLDLLDTDQN